jgi:putative endonuclease
MWFVYILRCADGSLYCGISTNLEQRIYLHNEGEGSKYVASRLPAVLVYSEPSENRSTASKREYQIKQLSREQKLQLISNA